MTIITKKLYFIMQLVYQVLSYNFVISAGLYKSANLHAVLEDEYNPAVAMYGCMVDVTQPQAVGVFEWEGVGICCLSATASSHRTRRNRRR